MTINRQYICDYILKQGQIPAFSIVPTNMPNYTPYEFGKENPEEARKILAEAGYPGGKGFPKASILYNTSEGHQKIAEAIQQMWKQELNIDVELQNQEWRVYLATRNAGDYDIARAGWIGDYTDPNTFLDMWLTGSGNNDTNWSNPQYDSLIDKAKYEKDPKKRMQILQDAEKILMTDLPIIPIYFYVNSYMLKPYVKGLNSNIRDLHPMKWVYIQKTK